MLSSDSFRNRFCITLQILFYTEQYIHATTHARIPHFFMLYTQVPIVNVMGGLLILFALAVKVYVPAGIEPVSTSDPRLP